jgi:hypothetical protein
MSSGLAATFDLLATTPNQAAVPVLVAALDAPRQELRDQALDALLRRRSPPAELEILSRWKSLTQRWKTRVADCFGWLSGAIRQSLLHGDSEHYQCACQAAIDTRDYDQIPLLVAAAENKSHPHSPLATATVLELAELLAEELNGPRDYRIRRDPALQRQHVLGSLERTAGQFSQHGRRELIEAFVLLADRENASLKAILQSPNDRSFAPLIEVLVQSSRPAAMRLLLSCLDDAHAPLAALHALALRRDVSFLRHLVRKIGAEPARIVSMNLKRIESIPGSSNNWPCSTPSTKASSRASCNWPYCPRFLGARRTRCWPTSCVTARWPAGGRRPVLWRTSAARRQTSWPYGRCATTTRRCGRSWLCSFATGRCPGRSSI